MRNILGKLEYMASGRDDSRSIKVIAKFSSGFLRFPRRSFGVVFNNFLQAGFLHPPYYFCSIWLAAMTSNASGGAWVADLVLHHPLQNLYWIL